MANDFDRYYEEEMRYLSEAGREFAEAYPDRAKMLSIDAVEDRDPYVERLFEGFAFLTGRIRQKLDDDFPEFTQNLLHSIAPNFLRPVPSFCMMEFNPRKGMLQSPFKVEKGTTVLSNPVGPQYTPCKFQTTKDITVQPIELKSVTMVRHPSLGDGMELQIGIDEGVEISELNLNEIPVYIHGEKPLVFTLYPLITSSKSKLRIRALGQPENSAKWGKVQFGGFGENENLLPRFKNSFDGCRVLQEYFQFEEKFRSFKMHGWGELQWENTETIIIEVFFGQDAPPDLRFSKEHLKLHATPAVNLFEAQAHPVRLNHRHFEYLVTPDGANSDEIYHIESATGIHKGTGEKTPYRHYADFRHVALSEGTQSQGRWYQVRHERMGAKGQKSWISLGHQGEAAHLDEEFLSVTLMATNGNLPRQHLTEDSLVVPHGDFPSFCSFKNFTRPTPVLDPPKSQFQLWNAISHLNMNFASLSRDGSLPEILRLYDWENSGATKKLISGIRNVTAEAKDFLLGQQPIRGTELNVEWEDTTFQKAGESDMLGRVLIEYITQYASINHLVSLKFTFSPSGNIKEWEPKAGQCHSI